MLLMLADFLPKEYPEHFQKQGNILTALKTNETFEIEGGAMDPLEACARIVQVSNAASLLMSKAVTSDELCNADAIAQSRGHIAPPEYKLHLACCCSLVALISSEQPWSWQ
jgi:hypothetical protein